MRDYLRQFVAGHSVREKALGPVAAADRPRDTVEALDSFMPPAQLPSATDVSRRPFEGLWTDRVDSDYFIARLARAGALRDGDADRLRKWVTDGYVILPGAVSAEVCEAIKSDLSRAFANGDQRLHVITPGELFGKPLQPGTPEARMRVNDIYVYLESARKALFSESIMHFLRL